MFPPGMSLVTSVVSVHAAPSFVSALTLGVRARMSALALAVGWPSRIALMAATLPWSRKAWYAWPLRLSSEALM